MLGPIKFFKKVTRILRGGSTITEIGLAVTLGMLLGFLPEFSLLSICLICLLLLMNTPIHLAVLAFLLGKALSLPLVAVTYSIGHTILQVGPIESFVKILVNGPVTAWMDLDRYCTLGGIVLGGMLGMVLSFVLRVPIKKFREKMASLETDSEKFARFTSNFGVRVVMWLILGKAPKKQKTYTEVVSTKTHLFRKSGLILTAIALVLALGVEFLFAGYFAKDMIVTQMEQANGATVDIESLDLSLFDGQCNIQGLQVCDPDHLDRNTVSAKEVEINFGVGDLLSRRFVINEIRVIEAATDSPRDEAGERLYEDEPLPETETEDDTTSIYDYFEDAKLWKERVERIYRIYKRIAPDKTEEEKKETEQETIDRLGYRALRASYLVDEHPLVTIRKITVGGLTVNTGSGPIKLTLSGAEFSSDPALNEKNPTISFETADKTLSCKITFGIATPDRIAENVINHFTMHNVNLGEAQKMLSSKNAVQFKKGDADLEIVNGKFSLKSINIPVNVKLKNMESLFGGDSKKSKDFEKFTGLLKKNMDTIIVITGSPFSPRVKFEVKGPKITSPLDLLPGR